MTPSYAKLVSVLKQHGYSSTVSRRDVFESLEQHGPLNMHELIELVAANVNRASVYRTIALFEQLGVVQRLQMGWKHKLELSNDFQDHHHHLTCVRCGAVTPFHEPEALHTILAEIASENGFLMQQHQIELTGICEACQAC